MEKISINQDEHGLWTFSTSVPSAIAALLITSNQFLSPNAINKTTFDQSRKTIIIKINSRSVTTNQATDEETSIPDVSVEEWATPPAKLKNSPERRGQHLRKTPLNKRKVELCSVSSDMSDNEWNASAYEKKSLKSPGKKSPLKKETRGRPRKSNDIADTSQEVIKKKARSENSHSRSVSLDQPMSEIEWNGVSLKKSPERRGQHLRKSPIIDLTNGGPSKSPVKTGKRGRPCLGLAKIKPINDGSAKRGKGRPLKKSLIEIMTDNAEENVEETSSE